MVNNNLCKYFERDYIEYARLIVIQLSNITSIKADTILKLKHFTILFFYFLSNQAVLYVAILS